MKLENSTVQISKACPTAQNNDFNAFGKKDD